VAHNKIISFFLLLWLIDTTTNNLGTVILVNKKFW